MIEINYKITTTEDIEFLMQIRLEMLREVNNLPDSYEHDKAFIDESRRYFEEGDQTTVLAMGGDEAKSNGVTEISLDTTTMGRPLYESLGFKASDECMVMEL